MDVTSPPVTVAYPQPHPPFDMVDEGNDFHDDVIDNRDDVARRGTSVPLGQYWRSTLDLGDRVKRLLMLLSTPIVFRLLLMNLRKLIVFRLHRIRNFFFALANWLDQCDSKIVFERHMQSQVLYVVPITSILGRLALIPVGDTGTIPFTMRK
jgi:hypothetical protein